MTDQAVDETAQDASSADSGQPDTRQDTSADRSHEPQVDVDELVRQLEANADKIPTDRIRFLDRVFQPDYTRKLNALNLLRSNVEEGARASVREAGLEIPEDFSIFKNDGKDFLKLVKTMIDQSAAPIKAEVDAGKRNQQIIGYMTAAKEMYPIVAEHYEDAKKVIDADQSLLVLAHAFDGKAVPFVLQGAAYKVGYDKRGERIAELEKENKALRVGAKVGERSTKTGGRVQPQDATLPNLRGIDKLRAIAAQKLSEIEGGGTT